MNIIRAEWGAARSSTRGVENVSFKRVDLIKQVSDKKKKKGKGKKQPVK